MKSKTFVSENIRAIIAIMVIGIAFSMFLLLITRDVKLADTITSVILGALSSMVSMVLSYYFGSSKPHTDPSSVETTTVEVSKTEKKADE